MARRRKAVPQAMKDALVREAGMKCANPGCANYRTHLHHIRQWAVYETNEADHMIAICPACHDAVHHGELRVGDETIYRWKRIERSPTKSDHLYLEPRDSPKLLLGSISVTGETGAIVFELSPNNRLSFRILDGDIFLVNLTVTTMAGEEVLRIVENTVKRAAEEPVRYERRPGRIRVTAPAVPDFLPTWALSSLRVQEPNYASDGELIVLDVEVLEPGLVSVQGIWAEDRRALVITGERVAFIQPGMEQPLSLMGQGVSTVIKWAGPITEAMFDFPSTER